MAAKPPHRLVDCPPAPRHDDGVGMPQPGQWRNGPACGTKACAVAVLALVVAAVVTGFALMIIFLDRKFPSKDPEYMVAITGVTGLDVLSPPLSPVFNLTFQINNTRNANHEACVPVLSKVDVSYGDAFLAGGTVPPFCAGKMRMSVPVAARAWGENVAVPRFLGDQLAAELAAGDASVDVKVTMTSPRYCRDNWCNAGSVLSCKPKIGDGTYVPCRLDFL